MKLLGVALAVALTVAACGGDDETGGASTQGAGATGDSTSAGGAGGGGGTGGSGGQGGEVQPTCDDLGFCGEATDPGCAACAMGEGSCADELEACQEEPACLALNACIDDCRDGDDACFQSCENQHAGGIVPLSTLFECILCDECFVSCAGDAEACE